MSDDRIMREDGDIVAEPGPTTDVWPVPETSASLDGAVAEKDRWLHMDRALIEIRREVDGARAELRSVNGQLIGVMVGVCLLGIMIYAASRVTRAVPAQ